LTNKNGIPILKNKKSYINKNRNKNYRLSMNYKRWFNEVMARDKVCISSAIIE